MTTPTLEPAPVPRVAPRAVLLYDAACPFCCRSVALLARLDWRRRIELRDARNPTEWPPAAGLVAGRLLEEIHLVSADRRRVWAGFGAVRALAWRLPPLWLVAPSLYLPGVLPVGNAAYRWVARNRFRLVRCEGGACEVGNLAGSSGPASAA